jgi:hypothetical protein
MVMSIIILVASLLEGLSTVCLVQITAVLSRGRGAFRVRPQVERRGP